MISGPSQTLISLLPGLLSPFLSPTQFLSFCYFWRLPSCHGYMLCEDWIEESVTVPNTKLFSCGEPDANALGFSEIALSLGYRLKYLNTSSWGGESVWWGCRTLRRWSSAGGRKSLHPSSSSLSAFFVCGWQCDFSTPCFACLSPCLPWHCGLFLWNHKLN